jgi:magnesium transporter
MEMAATYSEILNGMTDVYGTIVSNNLNNVMKFLTSVTLIMTIPTLISSIMGMNVTFPFVTNVYSFWIVMVVIIISTVIASIWLKKKNMLK